MPCGGTGASAAALAPGDSHDKVAKPSSPLICSRRVMVVIVPPILQRSVLEGDPGACAPEIELLGVEDQERHAVRSMKVTEVAPQAGAPEHDGEAAAEVPPESAFRGGDLQRVVRRVRPD